MKIKFISFCLLFTSKKKKIKIEYKKLQVKSKNGALTKEEIIKLQNLENFFNVNIYLKRNNQVKKTPTKDTIDQKINKENNNNLPNTRSSAKNYIYELKNINKSKNPENKFINEQNKLFGNNNVNKKVKFD